MAHPLPRLRRRAEFLRIARGGRKWAAPGLILQASPASGPAEPSSPGIRVGFTASRKVGTAVARNRCRRRLRALAHRVLARQARGGFDFVLIARPATLTRSFDQLERDLDLALHKVGAHREESAAE